MSNRILSKSISFCRSPGLAGHRGFQRSLARGHSRLPSIRANVPLCTSHQPPAFRNAASTHDHCAVPRTHLDPSQRRCVSTARNAAPMSRAFIALGSNLGDRLGNIERSCREMEARGLRILRTSSLYETAPMYVKDQDVFLNGVCEVETSLAPMELLDELQAVENDMGRQKVVEKGPRCIDLDILLYDDLCFDNERLTIPHNLMLEREFVLRPLCQLIPGVIHPRVNSQRSYQEHLSALPLVEPRPISATPMTASVPCLHASDPKRKTHVMAILNVTPDSFSDGGHHQVADVTTLLQTVRTFIHAGATIIDVGGESTRPTSVPVSTEEEISRVVPVVELIRSLPEAANVAISIDTYHAKVAEAAVRAGADIINDISAGLMDPDMLPTVARLRKSVILMHTRGTPQTMSGMTGYDAQGDVISGVGQELSARVQAAEAAGIRRWRIILDAGIGFAKTSQQNLMLLRHASVLRQGLHHEFSDIPWLVGASRKGFIGKITGVKEPADRIWGTAAAVTASIQGGADIVRVHDAEEMTQVAKMADAIYRS